MQCRNQNKSLCQNLWDTTESSVRHLNVIPVRWTVQQWNSSQLVTKAIHQPITAKQESNALQTEKRNRNIPQKCHLSAHITSCFLQQQTLSLCLSHADSYPYWWLYSAGYCSTTGSLTGLSITSTIPSLRYGLPGKSPFTSECVPGGGMPVSSTAWESGSVTSSSIRLLDTVVLPAADCLSTDHWAQPPPQFRLVPEQPHRIPETRYLIFEQWEQQVRQLLLCSIPWLLTYSLPPSDSLSPLCSLTHSPVQIFLHTGRQSGGLISESQWQTQHWLPVAVLTKYTGRD